MCHNLYPPTTTGPSTSYCSRRADQASLAAAGSTFSRSPSIHQVPKARRHGPSACLRPGPGLERFRLGAFAAHLDRQQSLDAGTARSRAFGLVHVRSSCLLHFLPLLWQCVFTMTRVSIAKIRPGARCDGARGKCGPKDEQADDDEVRRDRRRRRNIQDPGRDHESWIGRRAAIEI